MSLLLLWNYLRQEKPQLEFGQQKILEQETQLLMSQLILALVFSSTAHLLFDNILPLQISLLQQNLHGSGAQQLKPEIPQQMILLQEL
jgi:hypothetical protein